MKTRLGTVPYLNALPIFQSLLVSGNPDMTLIFDKPRRLSTELAGGLLQGALCPAIKAVMGDYEILPTHGIIARGPVASVHLYSDKEPQDWKTVAVDPASVSSAALVKVLCHHYFKNQAQLLNMPREKADAYFLIGDEDLKRVQQVQTTNWDLGELWFEMTGLPFLFAAWVVRPTIPEGIKISLDQSFIQPTHPDVLETLSDFSDRLGLSVEVLKQYLTQNIHYQIDESVWEGFQRFVRYFSEIQGKTYPTARLATIDG